MCMYRVLLFKEDHWDLNHYILMVNSIPTPNVWIKARKLNKHIAKCSVSPNTNHQKQVHIALPA